MKSSRTLKEYSAENLILQHFIWLQKEQVIVVLYSKKSEIVVHYELKLNTFLEKKLTLLHVRYCYHNMTSRKIINELFMSTK